MAIASPSWLELIAVVKILCLWVVLVLPAPRARFGARAAKFREGEMQCGVQTPCFPPLNERCALLTRIPLRST